MENRRGEFKGFGLAILQPPRTLLFGKNMKKIELVEIARSFSMKKNLGNYESVDFFCSQKAEVPMDIAEETSEALYDFCKKECVKSYNAYLKEASQPNDSEYGNLPNATITPNGSLPKVFKAKDTDSWRGSNAARYHAEKDEDGNTVKVLTDREKNTKEAIIH